MKADSRTFILISLVIIGISLGALREFIFINLNYWIDHVARHTQHLYAHSFFDFLQGSSLGNLKMIKWTVAIGFVVLMLIFTILFLEVFFRRREVRKWVVICFTGTLVFSASFFLLHLICAPETAMLSISVKAFHALQYPFFIIVLIPAITLFKDQGNA